MSGIRPRGDSAALMLNATYEPLGVVSVRRAVILVLSGKAVCVQDGDGILHSERERVPVPPVLPGKAVCGQDGEGTLPGEREGVPVPLVVRLPRYVGVPSRTHVGLSRRAISAGDGGRCPYGRGPAETIDHVMPRSRGG